MKKRFIYVMCLVLLFTIALSGCGDSTNQTLTDGYSFFKTENSEEYLGFLNKINSSNTQEIISISNSSYGYEFSGPITTYTITYKVCDNKDITTNYEYLLFESTDEKDYSSFLEELGDEYEIVDISIGSYAFKVSGPHNTYIVTYRKPI